MKRKLIHRLKIGGIVVLSTLCLAAVAINHRRWQDPEKILQEFYDYGVEHGAAEDMLMDPLILAGSRVVPLIIKEVGNVDMPKRRYAIGFLGNGGYREAIPVLKKIIDDEHDNQNCRGDALISLYRIDKDVAQIFIKEHNLRSDYLGYIAGKLTEDPNRMIYERSFFKALIGYHD